MSGETSPYALRLPEVSSGNRKRQRTLAAHLAPDCRVVLTGLFADSTQLWSFEARARLPECAADPNRLTYANYDCARLLEPDCADWSTVLPACEAALPPLTQISTDAGLLSDFERLQPLAVEALLMLTETFGLEASLASRLLYQKRPGVFPILEGAYRRALNVRPPQPSRKAMFERLLAQTAAVATLPENDQTLTRLTTWLAARPATTHGLALTRLRMFNLLAAAISSEAEPADAGAG